MPHSISIFVLAKITYLQRYIIFREWTNFFHVFFPLTPLHAQKKDRCVDCPLTSLLYRVDKLMSFLFRQIESLSHFLELFLAHALRLEAHAL